MKIKLSDYKKQLEQELREAARNKSGYAQSGIAQTLRMIDEDIEEFGPNHKIEI
jgi:hypothetical protein